MLVATPEYAQHTIGFVLLERMIRRVLLISVQAEGVTVLLNSDMLFKPDRFAQPLANAR